MNRFIVGGVILLVAISHFHHRSSAAEIAGTVTYLDRTKTPKAPLTYFDPKSRVTFYVESDGRHVTALNSAGKILWHRDPFVDSRLAAYRVERPMIIWIGEADRLGKKQLGISFNSSQFGVLDSVTGNFKFLGQD